MKSDLNATAHDGVNPMTFQESIRVCLTKYAEFSGKATRPEFWWFALFVLLVTAGLTYASEILGSMFLIAMLLPLSAVGTRRFHDIGKSGWWLLFALIPVAGIFIVGAMLAQPGTAEPTADELRA